MKEEHYRFLALAQQLPARLTSEQVAWMLGCQTHDIPILIAFRLLKPLGNPSQNGTKYFATVDLTELMKDRHWLVKMTQTISQHWHKCNLRQRQQRVNETEDEGQPTLRVAAKAA